MRLYNTPDNRRIELTRDEYLKLCKEYNVRHTDDQLHQYELAELVYLDTDVLTITESMLDECDVGFYMFSDHFYDIMRKYTDYPLIHDEEPTEVTI